MPYGNIPGIKITLLDGGLSINRTTDQPRILVVGPAESGSTNEYYTIGEVAIAEKEFGASSPVLRTVHELIAQGADNIAIMRSGGTQGSWVFTDSNGNTLTIIPEYRDDKILERYKLVIENDGSENRYLVYDANDEAWVYDSDEVLVQDEGLINITDTGIDLFTLGDKNDLTSTKTLADVTTSDFTADGTATATSVSATEGTDGTSASYPERYAALASSYHLLDYRDADFIIPVDVWIDAPNIADDDSHTYAGTGSTDAEKYGYYWKGVPEKGSAEDALGFVWQYRYRGKVYTYMTDVDDYFTGLASAATASATVSGDITISALKAGKGGNGVTIEVDTGGAAGPTVTVTETDYGIDIKVTDNGSSTTADAVTAINTALAATTLRSGVLASTLVEASGGSTATLSSVTKTHLSGGVGGAVLTHEDLTGDSIPTNVSTKFSNGSDAELREDNFAHQLATFCHIASTNWSTILGAISFKEPEDGYTRSAIASWIGELPEFTDDGVDEYIDSPSDNGSGVLGHKLIVGQSKTGAGYRSSKVTNGDATDGYAWGGFILTTGASLPNGEKWPYGIDDSDEATDSGGRPVDIGRYIFVTYDWPVHNNTFNGGSVYRGPISASFIGKLATMDENVEPIGVNGTVSNVQMPTRVHSTQINDLTKARIIGIRRDVSGSYIFTSAHTMAHPDSDYTKASTIRCANRILSGIRNLARPYSGKAFTAQNLASLQADIDGYLLTERGKGIHQGASHKIVYTREDRIMGNLKIKLRIVPPFSIEAITVEMSLAATESEL